MRKVFEEISFASTVRSNTCEAQVYEDTSRAQELVVLSVLKSGTLPVLQSQGPNVCH
jgi:hypothetical protein